MTLSEYLKSIAKVKKLSMYRVYKNMGDVVSYAYVQQMFRGEMKNPNPLILKAMARALTEPYFDLLKAAGYVTDTDLDSITNRVKREIGDEISATLKEAFDDNAVDILYREEMIEILNGLKELEPADLDSALNALLMFIRGIKRD